MSASLVCRIGYLLLTPLLLQPFNAAAAEGLPAAIKAADAKYLTVPDVTPKDDSVKIEAGGWEEGGAKPAPREIVKGAVKATLTYRKVDSDGDALLVPIVTVFADGKEVAKIDDEDAAFPDPPVSVQIAELDPSNRYPEVVVSYYTGGAHCCSNTSVITGGKDRAAWSEIDVGQFDGGPLTAVDLDGDGAYEFETRDNAFLRLRLLCLLGGAARGAGAARRRDQERDRRTPLGLVRLPECRGEKPARRGQGGLGPHARALRQSKRLGLGKLRSAPRR